MTPSISRGAFRRLRALFLAFSQQPRSVRNPSRGQQMPLSPLRDTFHDSAKFVPPSRGDLSVVHDDDLAYCGVPEVMHLRECGRSVGRLLGHDIDETESGQSLSVDLGRRSPPPTAVCLTSAKGVSPTYAEKMPPTQQVPAQTVWFGRSASLLSPTSVHSAQRSFFPVQLLWRVIRHFVTRYNIGCRK